VNSIWTKGIAILVVYAALVLFAGRASASTYVVYVPLDSPIYWELETLNGLGLLDTYLDEVRPISRVEGARLTLEAEHNLKEDPRPEPLARRMIKTLNLQLTEEIGWLQRDNEDYLPTMIHPVQNAEAQYLYSD
jgi:hypothetical protein